MHRRTLLTFLLSLLLFVLSACVTGTGTGVVSGTVLFTNEPPPPSGNIITVEIYTMENAESPPVFVSRAFVPSTGAASLPFAIAYDKAQIVPKNIYIIQAYIDGPEGRSVWRSDFWNVIITQGRQLDEIELRLRKS